MNVKMSCSVKEDRQTQKGTWWMVLFLGTVPSWQLHRDRERWVIASSWERDGWE